MDYVRIAKQQMRACQKSRGIHQEQYPNGGYSYPPHRKTMVKHPGSIGLLKGLSAYAESVGFIKPVGQRYVTIDDVQVDEDAVLIKRICDGRWALKDMNPVAVPQYFTREYLDNPENFYPRSC